MKARLLKETRDLLPAFASMLTLIVGLCSIWPMGDVGILLLGVACVVMAGSTFGSEFQNHTFSLLLSQPIARSVVWRDKMLVLGAAMVLCVAALAGCLAVHGGATGILEAVRGPGSCSQQLVAVALIPLCAFCGAPCWTLLLRHTIGGMVLAAVAPYSLVVGGAFGAGWFSEAGMVAYPTTILGLLLIYCASVYWLGYASFKRLQVVDGPARDVGLPEGLEARLTRPLTMLSSRFQSPFASLLKKEYRLQQISFLLAGLFFLIAVAGSCLLKHHPDPGSLIVGSDFVIYVLVLPLVAGAVSVAEEKGWDLAEWHLTLPPSALQQWSAKMLAALSTSFVLGLVLPAVLLLAGDALFAKGDALSSLPPASLILGCVLGQLLLTSLAIYAASFSSTTLKAILAAFALIIAGCGICALVENPATKIIVSRISELRRMTEPFSYHMERFKIVLPMLLVGGLYLVLCLVHWFAWSNFRRSKPSPGRVVIQVLAILLACGLITLAIEAAIFLIVSKGTVPLQ